MDLKKMREKPARFVIGLMTGTSSDGVDAVLVRIKGTGPSLVMKFIAHQHLPFSQSLSARLINEHMGAKEICQLNVEVGESLAEAARAMLETAKAEEVEVDFIASHGQTVAHYPPPDNTPGGTLQIGEPAVIAERTGLPVVSDFRQRDIAAGGQGAPLVPYADWLLWRDKKEHKTLACLNLGGIANFTVVTPELDDVIAFDTGPANMAIDGAVRQLTRNEQVYDKDGQLAADGIVIDEFLEYLLSHSYFDKLPPKSTGREEFGAEVYLRDALTSRREHTTEDLVATVTMAVAKSIVEAYHRFIRPQYKVDALIIGGGGAKNRSLLSMIQKGVANVPVFTTDQYGIPHGAREAIAFAVLGNETICGTPSNVPQATGAERAVVLGKITPA